MREGAVVNILDPGEGFDRTRIVLIELLVRQESTVRHGEPPSLTYDFLKQLIQLGATARAALVPFLWIIAWPTLAEPADRDSTGVEVATEEV